MTLGRLRGILGYKMPLDWLKIGLNSVELITGKLIQKSNSPLRNCHNQMGIALEHSNHIVKVSIDAIC